MLREPADCGERGDRDQDGNEKGEQEGMRKTAVAERVIVPHAEKESDHVEIRQERADYRQDPEAHGHPLRKNNFPKERATKPWVKAEDIRGTNDLVEGENAALGGI